MGETFTLDDAPIVREVRGLVGALSDDEAALVRTLTPAEVDAPGLWLARIGLLD